MADRDEARDTETEHLGSGEVATGLVINEVMTDNDSAVSVEPGIFDDYVELFHGGAEAIDLATVTLDDGGDVWRGSGVLEPGEFLVLWADELPFGLSRSGDELTLRADGAVLDRLDTGELGTDVAWVRYPDGGDWNRSLSPTPGWTNGSTGRLGDDMRSSIFGEGVVNELRLTLPTSSAEALYADPYTEVVGSLVAGQAVFPQINVRLKGGYGSFRELDEKAAFRLDLGDHEDWTWRGLEVLTLNNAMQDPTFVHEFLTYSLFRAAGVAAPEVGWVQLYVNQELYGLYILVETMDGRFLERWYEDPDGPYFEGGGYVDFTLGQIELLEHDGGEDDRSQLDALAELIDGDYEGDAAARLDELVDLDQVARFFAVEAMVDHWDGYRTPNNYRIYVDPAEGIQLLPWGCDQTLEGTDTDVEDGDGLLFQTCLQDATCSALFDEALVEVAALVDELELEAQLARLNEALGERIDADPRIEHGDATVIEEREITARVLAERPDYLTDYVANK